MNKTELYLGVDPGRDKTGAALVTGDGTLVRQAILPTEGFLDHLKEFLAADRPAGCVLGEGTTSKTMHRQLAEAFPQLPLYEVDEYGSTQEAKKLYWQLNPPRGWKKLLPTALLSEPSAVDGLAAVVLVKRFLCDKTVKQRTGKSQK